MTPVSLAGAVLAQARRTPDSVAVVDGDVELTYAELERGSAAAAHALVRHGVGAGEAVAVCLPRSWRLVCAMLGILRVGGTVVPLDGQSPASRRRAMLTDSGAVAVIHSGHELDGTPDGVAVLPVESVVATAETAGPPLPAVAPAPVSFVFYTSGTTGAPKGVEVRDAGILRLAQPGYHTIVEGARYACLSNPAFDAISFEVWVPLLTGGCCVVLGDDVVQSPPRLAQALRLARIDTLFITVALFNAVVDAVPTCFATTGQVLVGGEQLNARIMRRWYADNPDSPTRLHNVYGPTETTTFALCHPIPRDFSGDVVPIGQPLPQTVARLLGDDGRPAGAGEVAQLYLGGSGLAAGYRNLPEETARRFVVVDGERLYRTGDLVRRTADGDIEYVGRADRQVKVRGFRIEPGEVERHLATHPAVRQVYVCTRREPTYGVNELLAYVVVEPALSLVELERHVADGLPGYMRPHRIYRLESLPRNANGKVDQEALLLLPDRPWRDAGADEAPGTALEREVLELARQVLGVPDLRLRDRWLACGGDSLKALRLRFEARARWDVDVPQDVVLYQDIAAIAAAIAAAVAQAGAGAVPAKGDGAVTAGVPSPYPAPPPATAATSAPATSEQQRLWLIQQRAPESRAYHVDLAYRVSGDLRVPALREALRRLVARHVALRTAFHAAPDGLRQVVAQPYDPWVEEAELAAPFDLAQPRMLRATLSGGVLRLTLHHIAVDGWSLTVLFTDLSAEYAAIVGQRGGEPGPDPLTPLDFAAWQAQWFGTEEYGRRRDALRAFYSTVDPAEPLPEGRTVRLLESSLDVVRRAALDRLGARLGLTRFQMLLALFAWAVYGVTGRTELRVASVVANRPVREFAGSVGMFANTVLLPVRVRPDEELVAQLGRLAGELRPVVEAQEVALADVVADAVAGRGADAPLFDCLFVLDNTDFAALELAGCTLRPLWLAPADPKCALTLSVVEHESGLVCLWEYAADVFDAAGVAAMATLLRQGLDQVSGPEPRDLASLVAAYRRSLPDPGRGPASEVAPLTIAEAFAAQVRRTPEAIALVGDGRRLTYAELDGHAAALATQLWRAYPADSDDAAIALYLEASIEHVVALLALARLNITIVPLDPSYPPALLAQVLDQVRPSCILVAPGDAPPIETPGIPRHRVDLAGSGAGTSDAPLPPHAGRPLYTLFTSGSTGTPKGVRVHDRTLANLLQWQSTPEGGLPGGAVTQQFSMLSFDVSFQEIFGTLCGGGRLHLVRPRWRQDLPALLDQLDAAGIERLFLPYVALQLLAEHAVQLGRWPARLRDVVTAGEQLICTDAIRRWFAGLPGARLHNHYGPSETHVVSALVLSGDPAAWPERPAIGTAIANTWLRVVDAGGQVVPPGSAGELLIGGPFVQPCYLGDSSLNEARFTHVAGLGWFLRSGDRVRFDRDGLLHFLGREDQQVKVSGHRLELGAVEAALLRHPAVVNAVVVHDAGRLVACLQCRDGAAPAVDEFSVHLATLLPDYVRVDRFRVLPRLPRTPSGKLDRRAALTAAGVELGGHPAPRPDAGTAGDPGTATQARLAELFQAVVGRPIGPDQRFFDAGATSLDLMRFHLRCSAEPGLTFGIPELFEHVTIRRLAALLDRRSTVTTPTAEPSASTVDEPIAVVGMAVRLPGADDLAAFWSMVESGGRGIEHVHDAPDGLVPARSQLRGPLEFDPAYFGISRREARLMDPQQRHLLMCCVQALSHAGIADPATARVGLVASCGENTYFQTMLREVDAEELPDEFQLALHHEKDFLATKAAFHLGLTGPAFTVQAACSSSLVAVHVAAGLLRTGDAEVMLAGGVLVDPLLTNGYRYRPQHIFSPDGHCRPFSDDASGTIGGSGVGVVVLKRLSAARRDGDTVYAVVTGSALNNDGTQKLSFSAPALAGQREVIQTALRRSGRTAADVGYVEAHGTGTELGDPVEVSALRQAYGLAEPELCALTSVKSQIGHLGAAAGIAGLVRACLSIHHGQIPPNVDFRRLNPRIDPDPSPFYVPPKAQPWPADRPRVAAVSSFGIGGTNAHLVIEAGPAPAAPPPGDFLPCLLLSATSEAALRADAVRIAEYLAARPERYGQVLRHLQAGRAAHPVRIGAVFLDAAAAVAWLRTAQPVTVTAGSIVDAGADPDAVVAAWLRGATVRWPAGPAQAPWDFPPPSFDLAEYDLPRRGPRPADASSAHLLAADASSAEGGRFPARRDESRWLYQPHWVRRRRATTAVDARRGCAVLVTAQPAPAEAWEPLLASHRRVVRVSPAPAFARVADDSYVVDPAHPDSLRRLLDALGAPDPDGVDWVHALPLAVDGPVDSDSIARAGRVCLDAPAALLQAVNGTAWAPRTRAWWLSHQAQPVTDVLRPELGLLAGPTAVGPQESPVDGRWIDLPGPDLAASMPALAALLCATGPALPRKLALREGYWWEQALLPIDAVDPVDPPAGMYLVLGGTGGIGVSLARWLLRREGTQVLLLARRAAVPVELAGWADRVGVIEADLAREITSSVTARIAARTERLDGIVHAAGVPAGTVLARRDAEAMRKAMAAKVGGALLIEHLVEAYKPSLVAYCSSMSAHFGGVGQWDYAAANGLLDGFAQHGRDGATVRVGINWDVWRDVGMARDALRRDERHQAHLAVGLSAEEGQRTFGRALAAALPQLMVCTTAIEEAGRFYEGRLQDTAPPEPETPQRPAETTETRTEFLAGRLREWLDLDALDPAECLYDLGADSLTLVDLIGEIQRSYGVVLELSQLSHRVSLAEILALLESPAHDDAVTVEVWQHGTGRDVLCLVHPVGGDIQAYRPLVEALGERLTVCLIADPGLARPEPLTWSLPDRARRYLSALSGRFPAGGWHWHLAGWSFGAWVALAMAALAEADGRPARAVHLIDPPAPDAGPALRSYDERRLAELFASELGEGAATPDGRAYAQRLARCGQTNLASMAEYTLPRLDRTPGHVFLAAQPPPAASREQWSARLAILAGWRQLETTHAGIVRPPHVAAIAGAINAGAS